METYHEIGTFLSVGEFEVKFPEGTILTDSFVNETLDALDQEFSKNFKDWERKFFDTDDYEISEDLRSFRAEVSLSCKGRYSSRMMQPGDLSQDRYFEKGSGTPYLKNDRDYMDYVGDDVLYVLKKFFEKVNAEVSLSFNRSTDLEFDDGEVTYDEPDMDEY